MGKWRGRGDSNPPLALNAETMPRKYRATL